MHVVEKPSVFQIEVHVGAVPLAGGQPVLPAPPLELPPPPELELLEPDMRMPPELLLPPPELELLEPPGVGALELLPIGLPPELLLDPELLVPPKTELTPELLDPPLELELELAFPEPAPEPLGCSLLLPEPNGVLLSVDPCPPSSPGSPPSHAPT